VASPYIELFARHRIYTKHEFALTTGKPIVDSSAPEIAPRIRIFLRHKTRELQLQKQIEDANLSFVRQFQSMHDHADMPWSIPAPRRNRPFSKSTFIEELFGMPSFAPRKPTQSAPHRSLSDHRHLEAGMRVVDHVHSPSTPMAGKPAPRTARSGNRPHRISEPPSSPPSARAKRPAPRPRPPEPGSMRHCAEDDDVLHAEQEPEEPLPGKPPANKGEKKRKKKKKSKAKENAAAEGAPREDAADAEKPRKKEQKRKGKSRQEPSSPDVPDNEKNELKEADKKKKDEAKSDEEAAVDARPDEAEQKRKKSEEESEPPSEKVSAGSEKVEPDNFDQDFESTIQDDDPAKTAELQNFDQDFESTGHCRAAELDISGFAAAESEQFEQSLPSTIHNGFGGSFEPEPDNFHNDFAHEKDAEEQHHPAENAASSADREQTDERIAPVENLDADGHDARLGSTAEDLAAALTEHTEEEEAAEEQYVDNLDVDGQETALDKITGDLAGALTGQRGEAAKRDKQETALGAVAGGLDDALAPGQDESENRDVGNMGGVGDEEAGGDGTSLGNIAVDLPDPGTGHKEEEAAAEQQLTDHLCSPGDEQETSLSTFAGDLVDALTGHKEEEASGQQLTDHPTVADDEEAMGLDPFAHDLAAALTGHDQKEATAEKQDVAKERNHQQESREALPALREDLTADQDEEPLFDGLPASQEDAVAGDREPSHHPDEAFRETPFGDLAHSLAEALTPDQAGKPYPEEEQVPPGDLAESLGSKGRPDEPEPFADSQGDGDIDREDAPQQATFDGLAEGLAAALASDHDEASGRAGPDDLAGGDRDEVATSEKAGDDKQRAPDTVAVPVSANEKESEGRVFASSASMFDMDQDRDEGQPDAKAADDVDRGVLDAMGDHDLGDEGATLPDILGRVLTRPDGASPTENAGHDGEGLDGFGSENSFGGVLSDIDI
jgi:hypothetical protein